MLQYSDFEFPQYTQVRKYCTAVRHESTSLQTCRARESIGPSGRFCIPVGSVDAFRRSFFLRPAFCCHHVSFHRGVSVSIGRRHTDVEDRLDPSCFYQHFCTFLSVPLLEFSSCFHHFMHICHVQYYSQEELYVMERRRRHSLVCGAVLYVGPLFCRTC